MVPDQLSRSELEDGTLVEVSPGLVVDVPLYWHRWRIDSLAIDTLTRHVRAAAQGALAAAPG